MFSRAIRPDVRERTPPPCDDERGSDEHARDDQPVILVPESQEKVSDDSQQSDGFVESSLPAQEAANPPAHPNSPPPSPPPPRIRLRDELPPNSPLTPLDYDQTSSEDEAGDHLKLTNTVTGEVKRFRHDNNGQLHPF
jgi:hypothetical protein